MKIVVILAMAFNLYAENGGGTGGGGGPQMKAWKLAIQTVREADVGLILFEDGREIEWEEVRHVEYLSNWMPKVIENIDWIELEDHTVYFREEIQELECSVSLEQ